MSELNILLLCGGGSAEHEVSLVSANFLESQLKLNPRFNVTRVEITQEGWKCSDGHLVVLDLNQKALVNDQQTLHIDYVVPCIHGFPGETAIFNLFLRWQVFRIWAVALKLVAIALTKSHRSCGMTH